MGREFKMNGIGALAFMSALQGVQISPSEEFGEQFIGALIYLPELEGVLKKDLVFHKSLIDAVTLLIEPDLKDNWVQTLLKVDSLPVVGDSVTISLDQLIAVAKTSSEYPPEVEGEAPEE